MGWAQSSIWVARAATLGPSRAPEEERGALGGLSPVLESEVHGQHMETISEPRPHLCRDGQLFVCLRHLWPRGLSSPMSVHVLFCGRQLTGRLPGVEPWASPVWWVLWGFPHLQGALGSTAWGPGKRWEL